MELGEKILELRKKMGLSQEDLAEKVSVTRQTISKWELGETCPDIKQAKELSKIFKVSLDELVSNDISDIMMEKVSNTERFAGVVLKGLKYFGILLGCMFIVDLIVFIIFLVSRML